MYSINTQLAYFKWGPDPERMLVNITWFRSVLISDLKIQGVPLNDFEIEEFVKYIKVNKSNFPGKYFIQEATGGNQNIFNLNAMSTSRFPYFLILSDNNKLAADSDSIYKVMPVVLTDESYCKDKHFSLGFDLVGKIQVYKIN